MGIPAWCGRLILSLITMSRRPVIILQSLVLFVVGSVFLMFYVQGRIGAYLTSAGSFQMQALLAGLVLCIVALFLLLTSGKGAACTHDHGHDEDGGGDHHHDDPTFGGSLVTGLVMLVPLVGAAILTPDAYSKYWVENNSFNWDKGVVGTTPEAFDLRKKSQGDDAREPEAGDGDTGDAAAAGWGPYTIDDFKEQVDRNAAGEFEMDVISIFYTGGDGEVQNVVNGLPVVTLGQVMPEKIRNPDGTRLRVFRLMMNCCVADARPVSIPVEFVDGLPDYKEMGWYKIHGTMSYEKWDEFDIPVLQATRMEPTEEPDQGTFGQRQ